MTLHTAPARGSALRQEDAPPLAPPLRRWAAIWESGVALVPVPGRPDPAPLAEMTLCLEFTLPAVVARGAVRLWQGATDPRRAIGLYAMPDGALRLVQGEIDLSTPPAFARPGEIVALRYRTCARGRGDIADFVNLDRGQRFRGRAALAHAARLDEALPRDARFLQVCHVAAIAAFGVAPTDIPALASGAVVPTARGPRPVESLQAGDRLITVTGEALPLRWVERRARLCLGRGAPVRLRAPYFGLEQDICVTPETRVMRSGPTVEYLFGEERVLVRAGDMILSPGAHRDRRRPVQEFHHLMFDDHACVAVDRCGVESALLADVIAAGDAGGGRNLSETDRTPCLPVLNRVSTQALMSASARGLRSLT